MFTHLHVHYRWNGHWRRVGQVKTWRSRVGRQQEAWGNVFDQLVQRYLTWKYQSAGSARDRDGIAPDGIVPEPRTRNDQAEPRRENEPAVPPLADYSYTVNVFDITTLARVLTVQRHADSTSLALDLMLHSYVAKSPSRPTIAVSVETLQLLYRLHQRKPSYSIEAFAKVVCDYYNIPYRHHLREVFGDTFEIYLRIMRSVHCMIQKALGWDEENWRVKNACHACCYKLEDEPELRFGRLIAMDGNNSLKRIATTAHRTAADTRILHNSNYFLSTDFVNQYANEVRGKYSKGPAGDPTDGLRQLDDSDRNDPQAARRQRLASCTKNWKSAAKEDRKKMWGIFDEAGVFAAACRHGFLLWVMDMVCSGELAKYPLAIISKTLELLGDRPLIGYDVGCSFDVTTEKSSLGPAFATSGGRFCVCAFHGYSHSYTCQLEYHPNIIVGAGLEDLETMERIFSLTNMLASVTRYASPYRRRLFIEAYCRQLDEDKYHNAGTFILNNYKQALGIIHSDATTLLEAMHSLSITDKDLDVWEDEQVEFFSRIGDELPHDVHAVAYVERLQELRDLDSQRRNANAQFLAFAPPAHGANYAQDLSATRRVETVHRHANERYNRVHNDVCNLELQMGIVHRWTTTTPEYIAAIKYIKERKYLLALNKVQKLVVQRLTELSNMNIAQTGYSMRTHISKSLQTRSKAIQTAVATYNAAATALDPPRPPLDWQEIGNYQFLEQFALLQDTRHDVRGKRWIEPAVRACMKMRLRIRRAREEVERLNVEVRRLHTAIRDERRLFPQVRDRLQTARDPILGAVLEFIERRQRINSELLSRVHQVYSLDGFTGTKGPGTRVGTLPFINNPEDGADAEGDAAEDDEVADQEVDILEGDEEQEALGHLVEFISALSIT
ncbi:hypothetical protein BC835DRAFT_1277453 [Cytidiella melzeri]|nr:hypothetical protein BC835DRAFT_1277453 [Cytidiella melzeri]